MELLKSEELIEKAANDLIMQTMMNNDVYNLSASRSGINTDIPGPKTINGIDTSS